MLSFDNSTIFFKKLSFRNFDRLPLNLFDLWLWLVAPFFRINPYIFYYFIPTTLNIFNFVIFVSIISISTLQAMTVFLFKFVGGTIELPLFT